MTFHRYVNKQIHERYWYLFKGCNINKINFLNDFHNIAEILRKIWETKKRNYFRFPQDSENKLLWLRCLGITEESHNIHLDSRICSQHFRQEDFVVIQNKTFLKQGTLPIPFNDNPLYTQSGFESEKRFELQLHI